MSKTTAKAGKVADRVAEFIGRSMGELLNKKDTLTKQMADVDRQIADVRARVIKQFGSYLPATTRRARVRKAVQKQARAVGKAARAISTETREKMAEAARKRWARERAKKR